MNRTALLTALTTTAALALAAPALATGPANDNIGNAFTIAGTAKSYDLDAASTQNGEQTLPGSDLNTVWYKWTAPGHGAAYADVCGATGGTHLAQVYKLPANAAATIANLVPTAPDWVDNPVESTSCKARFTAVTGTTYYVQVDRTKSASYEHALKVVQDTTPPAKPALSAIGPVTSPTVKPTFTAGADAVATMCSINQGTWKLCTSGNAFGGLPAGKASLYLYAVDATGNLSQMALQTWEVDAQAPSTAIGPTPAVTTRQATPQFTFAVADNRPEATSSECRIDGGPWAPCASPFQAPSLPTGQHTVAIRSTDAVGNVEATPNERTWVTLPPEEARPAIVDPVLPKACTLSLKAPKSVKRSALKRGLKKAVRLSVKTTGPCTAKVAMKRRGGKVSVVVTAGSLKRTATVKVR